MKKILTVFLMILSTLLVSSALADTKAQDMGQPGTKTLIGPGWTLTYGFNAHPALGMLILKVRVTDKDGNPVEGITLTGVSDMPEMGDSNSGKVKFQQNKKKDFLLPVNVTMPGKWQVAVTVGKGRKRLFNGVINFNV
jgi:hypothetical protein